ncbi:hypothetical protein UFOVP116_65 [uncultured Caudovirales phage]|uniref:Uncharacterized protein n=1 Tax=uncultured Caudovirales phage TaxID=2100421 RepID=A0A6J5L9F0_9CAUD|nr:hypothetical protein UFOVP116_65 [uncultured Caudovirales phage]
MWILTDRLCRIHVNCILEYLMKKMMRSLLCLHYVGENFCEI